MPILACGRHDHQEYAHGVGVGTTFDSALDTADFLASQIAKNKAQQWYARQRCTDPNCSDKTDLKQIIGDLKVDSKVHLIQTVWIISVRVQILAWFFCDGEGYTGDYPRPPEEAIPQQYHDGHRPKP